VRKGDSIGSWMVLRISLDVTRNSRERLAGVRVGRLS